MAFKILSIIVLFAAVGVIWFLGRQIIVLQRHVAHLSEALAQADRQFHDTEKRLLEIEKRHLEKNPETGARPTASRPSEPKTR